MSRTLVFSATYNEVDNIHELISEVRKHLPAADVLVVDDASPDGTGELLKKLNQADPSIHVIHRAGKLGLGSAHKVAMKFALAQGYDSLISLDADFSHNPKYLPGLVNLLDSNDFVIGSRYVEGARSEYTFSRKLLSRTANALARLLLGFPLHDTTTAYRGYRRNLLERLPIDQIRSEGYSFFVESLFFVSRITRKLAELPIHFEDRRAGVSKINKKEILKGVVTLFRLFFMRLTRSSAIPVRVTHPARVRQ